MEAVRAGSTRTRKPGNRDSACTSAGSRIQASVRYVCPVPLGSMFAYRNAILGEERNITFGDSAFPRDSPEESNLFWLATSKFVVCITIGYTLTVLLRIICH